MRTTLEFDVTPEGIPVRPLSQLIRQPEELIGVLVAIAAIQIQEGHHEDWTPNDIDHTEGPLVDGYPIARLIRPILSGEPPRPVWPGAAATALYEVGLTPRIDRIRYESPLSFDTLIKLPPALAGKVYELLKTIIERLWMPETIKRHKDLENELLAEQVREKRIANIRETLKLQEVIRSEKLRQRVEVHVIEAMTPIDPVLKDMGPYKSAPWTLRGAAVSQDHK